MPCSIPYPASKGDGDDGAVADEYDDDDVVNYDDDDDSSLPSGIWREEDEVGKGERSLFKLCCIIKANPVLQIQTNTNVELYK